MLTFIGFRDANCIANQVVQLVEILSYTKALQINISQRVFRVSRCKSKLLSLETETKRKNKKQEKDILVQQTECWGKQGLHCT